MGLILTIIIGGIIGWLASIIMKTQEGLLVNIIIGIVGSLLGRWIFGNLLGLGGAYSAGSWSLVGIFWGVVGAVILIAILRALNVIKRNP